MKLLFALLTLCLAAPYGAKAQEKRLLTMEETILSRELVPQNRFVRWGADEKGRTIYGEVLSRENTEWYYPKSGKSAVVAEAAETSLPRYFTEENNLYAEIDGEKIAITADTDRNIVNGSHVSRNEFSIQGGIFPRPTDSAWPSTARTRVV